jgi:hypothetical protein
LIILPFAVTATAQLVVNPATVNFGSVPIGSSVSQSVVANNTGRSNLTISQATITGTGFSMSGLGTPLTLAPGQSVSLTTTFAPLSSGSMSGNLLLVYSVPRTWRHRRDTSSSKVSLTGTGTTSGQLAANPSSLNFANVQVGGSQAQSATLTNSGSGSLTVTQATLTNARFSLSGLSLPLTLAAGQSAAFSVAFAPQSAGSVSANLAFTSNASNPTMNLSLSGNAIMPGQLTANPASLAFGSIQVGNRLTLTDALTNTGGASVTVSQATLTNASFTLSGLTLPLTLGAGQSATFSVIFASQTAGSVSGNLAFNSNASNSTMNLALSGNAVLPGQLTANPASLAFGSVQAGNNLTLMDSLTNNGGASVTISQATVTGSGFSISGLNVPLTLNPGASVTFSAVFAPQSTASASGGITITSNASNSTLSVSLSGTGTAPGQLTLTPTALDFGSVTVGTNSSQTSSLSVSGASVTVSSASLSSAEFSLTGISLPMTISAGQSVPFTLRFAPQTSGIASATLSFASNASNAPAETLSGNGTAPPSHNVSLSWTGGSSGIVGYNVYRGSVSKGPYTRITSALDATPAYSDSSVQAGHTYYYVATAVDGSGTESTYSNEAQAVVPSP